MERGGKIKNKKIPTTLVCNTGKKPIHKVINVKISTMTVPCKNK
jgi:hypothetical protein